MKKLMLSGAIAAALLIISLPLLAQQNERLREMKVKSIYKFLDAKVDGLPHGWGKIKFGIKPTAFKNFFYTDFFGPGGRLLGLPEDEVTLAKVANTEVLDNASGKPLREKGTQKVKRYEFYFYKDSLFMVKIFYDDEMGETPWELALDDFKRQWGAPTDLKEKAESGVTERWAVWEDDTARAKLVQHFGTYDLTIYEKSVMDEIAKKAKSSGDK